MLDIESRKLIYEKNNQSLTKINFNNLTECECGKKIFKFHNTSTNVFYARCSNFDAKPKKNKLSACSLSWSFTDIKPILHENKKKEILILNVKEINFDKILEEKLRILFKFLYVSNNSSTLDEINILVKNKLKKESKFINELFEDYEKRIFSEKIKDLDFIKIKEKEKHVYFIDPKLIPKKYKIKPIKNLKKLTCNFIKVEENSESDNLSLENPESEEEEISDKENSDYEDESVSGIEETEENDENEENLVDEIDEENLVDDIEDTEEYCDYDDN